MKKRKIVVVSYGHPEIDASCLQSANRKDLVWIEGKDASEMLAEKFLIMHCKRKEYTEEEMPFYCKSVADQALNVLVEHDSLMIILAWEIREMFLKQLMIAKRNSEGDVLVRPFTVIDEYYRPGTLFDPEYVFSVSERYVDGGNGKKQWMVFLDKFVFSTNQGSYEESPAEFEVEKAYTEITAAANPDLNGYAPDELDQLLDKSLDMHNFGLTKLILAVKEKKAS